MELGCYLFCLAAGTPVGIIARKEGLKGTWVQIHRKPGSLSLTAHGSPYLNTVVSPTSLSEPVELFSSAVSHRKN